jgi:hypothetical protein
LTAAAAEGQMQSVQRRQRITMKKYFESRLQHPLLSGYDETNKVLNTHSELQQRI